MANDNHLSLRYMFHYISIATKQNLFSPASKAGDVALGYFYCQHIKTGKGAGGTFSIKCAANGAVTIS